MRISDWSSDVCSSDLIRVLDAYCRHMGGDLSMGTVKGDDIACPFHDWRWGASGKCTAIPYARRVPPLARTRRWTTLERNGQLFIWQIGRASCRDRGCQYV